MFTTLKLSGKCNGNFTAVEGSGASLMPANNSVASLLEVLTQHIWASRFRCNFIVQPSCHPPTLQSVVMGFLIDNGHWKTAQAAARDSTGSFEELTEKQIEV